MADRLGISTATVYRLVESGELAHARFRNSVRVKPDDLEAFLAGERR